MQEADEVMSVLEKLPYEETATLQEIADVLEDDPIGFAVGLGKVKARAFIDALVKELANRGVTVDPKRWLHAVATSHEYEAVEEEEPTFNRAQRRAQAAINREGTRCRR